VVAMAYSNLGNQCEGKCLVAWKYKVFFKLILIIFPTDIFVVVECNHWCLQLAARG